MRALIVYESMYGNTGRVAEAIADGLRERIAVDLVEVGHAPATVPDEVGLLVVGGPTHVHGLSRSKTRQDAALRVSEPVISAGVGIREWIAALPRGIHGLLAATFDTRAQGPGFLTGSAAKSAASALRGRGIAVDATASFVVARSGPDSHDLVGRDELERARLWGRELATSLVLATAAGTTI
jgi:Flavodoxin domain